jgi:hypothetical protein
LLRFDPVVNRRSGEPREIKTGGRRPGECRTPKWHRRSGDMRNHIIVLLNSCPLVQKIETRSPYLLAPVKDLLISCSRV